MEENIKNRILVISLLLAVIFLVIAIGSCNNTNQLKSSRDKEMAIRLDLEEKVNKVSQERQGYEGKIKTLEQALEEEKVAHQATKKALLQEQLVNQSLKEELQKVSRLKEALEEDLKEALVTDKRKPRQ